MSAPPSSLSELPHPRAAGPEAAPKSPTAIDSNRRRGHPRRWVASAIPRPNWRLPEDRAHTSHLPDRSTPFLHRLSSWTSVSTPTPTAPLRAGSPGEPLLPEMPQSSSPRCRVALAVIFGPPHRRSVPEFGRPPPPLLWVPTLPCLHMGRANARFVVGRWPSPVLWAAAGAVPACRVGTVQAGRALKPTCWP
jgi:hypothetical protein